MVAQADCLAGAFFSIVEGGLERLVRLADENCEGELIVDVNWVKEM